MNENYGELWDGGGEKNVPWVIGRKGEGQEPASGQGSDVAPGRVAEVEFCAGGEGSGALGYDPEVVAVEVDWVGQSYAGFVLDDPVCPLCRLRLADCAYRGR